VVVEFNYKIGDEFPVAYAYTSEQREDVSEMVTESLDDFIKGRDLKKVD